jgi:uncharacterized spore protein YtfJ
VDAENLLTKASENLSVRRAFGPAYERGDMLIIPVALVAAGGGGGSAGSHRQPEGGPAGHDATPQDAVVDSGAGFGGLVVPVGAYVVKGDQVRWVSAVDMTIVVLGSVSLARALARAWTRSRRHHGARPR